jgi:hypothetical protein
VGENPESDPVRKSRPACWCGQPLCVTIGAMPTRVMVIEGEGDDVVGRRADAVAALLEEAG